MKGKQEKDNAFMKHILYILLTAFFFTLFCPLTAFAAEIYTEGYFKYAVEDDSVSICEYYGKESEVTVPSAIAGNPVSTIARGAFSDNAYVEKVNLPDTIMTIEEGAFASGISIVYDSNTDNPIESGAAGKPSNPDDPSDNTGSSSDTENPGNEDNSGNTTAGTNEIGIEEAEVTLDETDTIPGIPIQNTGKTVTVNDKKQLVSVDADGTETVLDDTQEYTLTENADGTVTILNADGEEVSMDEDGNPVIPSAQKEKTDSRISMKTAGIIIAVIVILAIAITGIIMKKRKKAN